jgi:hypothetical protein
MSKKHHKASKSSRPKAVQPADLDNYCRRQRPVVVTNETDTVLMLSFADGPREHVVKVPNGKQFFCVSNYVPHSLISASSPFRRLLADRRITLYDYHTIDMDALVRAPAEVYHPEDDEEVAKGVSVEITQEAIPASPQVGYLVASVDVKEMTSREFLTKLETMKGSLTDRDLLYINDQLGNKHRKIREWATELLADLRAHHPDRCLGEADEDGDGMHRKLARKGRQVLDDAADAADAFAADGEGDSPKEKVRKMLDKNRAGVGEMGSAKERAKKLLQQAADARAAKRRTATDL